MAGIKIGEAFYKIKLKKKRKKKERKKEDVARCQWLTCLIGRKKKNKIMPFKKQNKGIKKQN